MLEEGTKAPKFIAQDQNNKTHKLSDYIGKKIILYFYPKDLTPGCTVEACKFRDDSEEFKKRDVVVLGVSCDPVAKHKKFEEKHELNFTLLSDPEKNIVTDYDVYGEKKFMGRTYMGINRITYIIDEDGKIIKVYPKVDVKKHSQEILEFLDSL